MQLSRFRTFVAGTTLGSVFPSLLIIGLLAGLASPARADHIDDKLIEVGPELVKLLQDKGFKNVGVLKFLVKKGKSPFDGNVGPLNINLAERLQNSLILGMDEAKPLGIIANATQIASKSDPKYSIKSVEARKALFAHKYPLAWGKDQVTADVFLAGTVNLSVDMKKTTLDIDYFDKSGAIKPLKKLDLKTDRSILADSGQSFTVAPRGLKKRSLVDLDEEAAASAGECDLGKSLATQLSEENEAAPVKFEILFNGNVQSISEDESSAGEMRIPTPTKGDIVTFNLTNTSKEKVAVVLKLNGFNTLEKEEAEDAACLKWILEAGKAYSIRGFYSQGKVDLLKVLDDEESAARMADAYGSKPRAGYIDLSVFRESTGDEAMVVGRSLRNPPVNKRGLNPMTPKDAKAEIEKNSNRKVTSKRKGRGLIEGGGGSEDKSLETDEMKNLTQIYQLHIGYYKSPVK